MVVDTSVLLAAVFNERHGAWAVEQLQLHRGSLRMSTVNYAETLILIEDRQPQHIGEIREALRTSGIRFVPPTRRQAETAAHARLRYPLNLGDCFAYALAAEEQCPILTLDRDFRKTDAKLVCP
jgi:ribonuclease VapC